MVYIKFVPSFLLSVGVVVGESAWLGTEGGGAGGVGYGKGPWGKGVWGKVVWGRAFRGKNGIGIVFSGEMVGSGWGKCVSRDGGTRRNWRGVLSSGGKVGLREVVWKKGGLRDGDLGEGHLRKDVMGQNGTGVVI